MNKNDGPANDILYRTLTGGLGAIYCVYAWEY